MGGSKHGRCRDAVLLAILCVPLVAVLALAIRGWPPPPAYVHVQIDGLAYRVTEQGWQRAYERSLVVFAKSKHAAVQAMSAAVKAQVAHALELPNARVEDAADWYFSARGKAARARITARGWWGGAERSEARKAAAIGKRLLPEAEWARAQSRVIDQLMHSASEYSQNVMADYRAMLHAELAAYRMGSADDTPLEVVDLDYRAPAHSGAAPDDALDRGEPVWSTAAGEVLAARRAAQAETLRAAGRESSLVCAHVGRFPRLCEAGVPAVTSVGAGLLVLFLDEQFNRTALEAALRQELERVEEDLTDVLGAVFVDGLIEDLAARKDVIHGEAQRVGANF
jgi:hypothetical protein